MPDQTPARPADGRTRHYGTFYGVPADQATDRRPDVDDAAPLLVVFGNCQAESVRVLLAEAIGPELTAVRIPPVFELTADDLPHLHRILSRTAVLVAQPVKDDYRDMPLGTAQVAAQLPPTARVVRWPVIRSNVLQPFQTIVRDPRNPSRDPPVVPYHDLRTLASAAAGRDLLHADISVAACRALGDASVSEMARRERLQCDVAISDELASPRPDDTYTINHPGNRILLALANRILGALGRPPAAADPGRVLLGAVRTPLDPRTAQAWQLPAAEAREEWLLSGEPLSAESVHRTQWQWYDDNPWVLTAGLQRHEAALRATGLW